MILILIVCSSFFALQLNVGKAKPSADVIKIGALGPLALTPGKDMQNAAELAVEEINDAGGISVGGTTYDLELYVESTSDPTTGLPHTDTAVTSLTKLQTSINVTASLGLFRTEVTLACMAIMDRPFLGVGSTAPIMTPYFFRTGPSNGSRLVTALVDLYAFGLGAALGVRKVAIVREDASWSLAMRNGIQYYLGSASLTLGLPFNMTFTSDVPIAEGADYDTVKTAFGTITGDPDAIMTIFSGPVGKHLGKAWAALDMDQFLAGINVEGQASTYFDETEGAAYGEIELETCPPDVDKTTKTKDFRDAYKAKYGELPTYTAFASYDSVYVIADALKRAGSTEKTALLAALENTDYEGAACHYKYTQEPGPQYGVNATGHSVPLNEIIPGVPAYGSFNVHDLYTRSTVGYHETKYIQGMFVQWQKGGVKKTIFLHEPIATRNISAHIEWPIDHAEHGWEPEEDEAPGFELPFILLALATLAMIVHMRKRKKR